MIKNHFKILPNGHIGIFIAIWKHKYASSKQFLPKFPRDDFKLLM